jgi:hypothetical protein
MKVRVPAGAPGREMVKWLLTKVTVTVVASARVVVAPKAALAPWRPTPAVRIVIAMVRRRERGHLDLAGIRFYS